VDNVISDTKILKVDIEKRPKTKTCYESLLGLVPGGVNSPIRSCKGLGVAPLVVNKGVGDMVYDIDGNGYVDYCGSWGPLIHGHAHPAICQAAKDAIDNGTSFGITCDGEEKLAKLIVNAIPSMEKVRFVSSGTEATMTAARLARGYTGRDLIVKFSGNYHGHADFFLVQAGSGMFNLTPTSTSAGIPQDVIKHTACLPYNDVKATEDFLKNPENRNKVACVILEPIAANMGCVPATEEFIRMLRTVTEEIGAVLIFDEVISGFRVGVAGAQPMYGVDPDMTCLGKIIGGGFPVAAFGGKKKIMDCLAPIGSVYQAGTLSGNPVAMATGYQAVSMCMEDGFYPELERKTNIITLPVKALIEEKSLNMCIQQVGSLFTLFFGQREVKNMEDGKKLDLDMFAKFFRYMLANGIYIPPYQYEAWFVSAVHEESHLEQTRDLILDFLRK
jgi:glutamate-1-semialdehyde 2,1-aminomutase